MTGRSRVMSRRGRATAVADCLDCYQDGVRDGGFNDDAEPQRRWAVAHVRKNPGHVVHLVTESVRVYRVYTADGDR